MYNYDRIIYFSWNKDQLLSYLIIHNYTIALSQLTIISKVNNTLIM